MSYAKIEDNPTLFRDMSNQHIVQTDLSVVRKHEARILHLSKERKQEQEIASIKADINEIKELLKLLLPSVPFGGARAQILSGN